MPTKFCQPSKSNCTMCPQTIIVIIINGDGDGQKNCNKTAVKLNE